MTEIQQNRWDRLIRRSAGIVGGGSQVNDTLNELFPVMDIERVPGELLALSGFRLGMCSSILAASAAEFNHHQLFNPANSGVLLTVTQVAMISGPATITFRFSTFVGALLVLAGNERRRDTRGGTTAELTGQSRTDQNAAGGGLDYRIRNLANETQIVKDENGVAILFPGTGLQISSDVLNTTSTVGFFWRERAFEPSEIVP